MCVPCQQMQASSSNTNSPHTAPVHPDNNNTTTNGDHHHHRGLVVPTHTGYDRLSPALRAPHQPDVIIGHLLQKRECPDSNTPETDAEHRLSRLTLARLKVDSFLDTHWGWVLSVSTFLMFFMIVGWVGCYSVLFISLQDEFGRSATETGWVGNLLYIVGSLSSPLTDCFLRKLSNRTTCIIGIITCSASLVSSSFAPQLFYLYFTLSLLYGVGWNLIFKGSMDLLMRYFPGNNCMRATSFVLMGSTVGLFCWTPIITKLLDVVGWRIACRISSGLILLLCLFFALPMKSPPHDNKKSSAPKDDTPHPHLKNSLKKPRKLKDEIVWIPQKEKSMLRMPEAWLFGLASLAPAIGMGFFNVNLVSYITSLGHSSHHGSMVVTITAASETGSKLLFAIIGDKLPFQKVHLITGISLISTLITLTCAFVSSFPLVCVVAVGIGFVKASMNTLPFPVGMEIFGPRKASQSSTLILFSAGVGTLVGGFIIGSAYDASNSYNISIYVCTGFFLLTSGAFLLIPLTAKIYKVIGVKVKVDEVTGTAEMVPVVEDEDFIIEEIVTTV
ncbi:monocarboxylate transporter 12-like [Asterias rubens]|uniref:monocarboxylate transporter 12-like n=1 Tax=Asterias rubens TaxID=7604 RepID=UPI0014550B23|nr:monocarboxylate transporter 12-like [Asterias rubens]